MAPGMGGIGIMKGRNGGIISSVLLRNLKEVMFLRKGFSVVQMLRSSFSSEGGRQKAIVLLPAFFTLMLSFRWERIVSVTVSVLNPTVQAMNEKF